MAILPRASQLQSKHLYVPQWVEIQATTLGYDNFAILCYNKDQAIGEARYTEDFR
jgi:hypothetical protein